MKPHFRRWVFLAMLTAGSFGATFALVAAILTSSIHCIAIGRHRQWIDPDDV